MGSLDSLLLLFLLLPEFLLLLFLLLGDGFDVFFVAMGEEVEVDGFERSAARAADAIELFDLHGDGDIFESVAAENAFVGGDVAEVPTMGDLDEVVADAAVVGGVEGDPAGGGEIELTPGVGFSCRYSDFRGG